MRLKLEENKETIQSGPQWDSKKKKTSKNKVRYKIHFTPVSKASGPPTNIIGTPDVYSTTKVDSNLKFLYKY